MNKAPFELSPLSVIIKRHQIDPFEASMIPLPNYSGEELTGSSFENLDVPTRRFSEFSTTVAPSPFKDLGDISPLWTIDNYRLHMESEKIKSKIQSQMEAHDLMIETLMLKLAPKFGDGLSQHVLSELTKSDLFLGMMEAMYENKRDKIYSAYAHELDTNFDRRF